MKDLDLVDNLYKYLNEKYRNNSFLILGSYPLLGVGNYYTNEEVEEEEFIEREKSRKAKRNIFWYGK